MKRHLTYSPTGKIAYLVEITPLNDAFTPTIFLD